MDDNISIKLDEGYTLLEKIDEYAKEHLNGLFTQIVDKSVLEQLDNTDIGAHEWYLYKINELVYSEDEGLKREAMENVLASFRELADINIVYMILGSINEVNFYLGVSKNLYSELENDNTSVKVNLGVDTVAKDVLEPSLRGNFVGSLIEEVDDEEKSNILNRLKSASASGLMNGIPGFIEKSLGEKTDFQGVERLADTMVGNEFGLVVIATPCNIIDVLDLEFQLNEVADKIAPIAKYTLQDSTIDQEQISVDTTNGSTRNISNAKSVDNSSSESEHNNRSIDKRRDYSTNISASSNEATNIQDGKTSSMNISYSNPKSYSHQKGSTNSTTITESVNVDDGTGFQLSDTKARSHSNQWSDTKNSSKAVSSNKNISIGKDKRITRSKNISIQNSYNTSSRNGNSNSHSSQISSNMEIEKKATTNWLKYIDEILLSRLDKGKSKGSFTVSTYLFTPTYRGTLYRLANSIMALYGGEKGNVSPLHFIEFSHPKNDKNIEVQSVKSMLVNLQNPRYESDEALYKSLFSKVQKSNYELTGSWLTVDELGLLVGLPQREVLGLPARNEAEYGVNVPSKYNGPKNLDH